MFICQIEWNTVGINGSTLPRQGEIGAGGAKVSNAVNVTLVYMLSFYIILHSTLSMFAYCNLMSVFTDVQITQGVAGAPGKNGTDGQKASFHKTK